VKLNTNIASTTRRRSRGKATMLHPTTPEAVTTPETSPVVALMLRCAGRLGFARNSMGVAARAANTVRLKGNRDSGAPTVAGAGRLVGGSSQPR